MSRIHWRSSSGQDVAAATITDRCEAEQSKRRPYAVMGFNNFETHAVGARSVCTDQGTDVAQRLETPVELQKTMEAQRGVVLHHLDLTVIAPSASVRQFLP